MKFWQRIIQAIGLTTGSLCGWGVYLLVQGFRGQLARSFSHPGAPFFKGVFIVMNSVDCLFLAATILICVDLLRLRHRAVKFYTWIYVCLVLYAFAPGALWVISGPVGDSIAAASGVGDIGLGPLLFFPSPLAYPILSVFLVQVSARRVWPATSVQRQLQAES